MPIVEVKTNAVLDIEKKNEILAAISNLISDVMNKPTSDIMVIYSESDFIMAGVYELAAFIDLKCVSGFGIQSAGSICNGIVNILVKVACLESSRVFVNFSEVSHVHAWRFINGIAVHSKDKKLESSWL